MTWPCDCCGTMTENLKLIRGPGIDPGNPVQLCYPCFEKEEDEEE